MSAEPARQYRVVTLPEPLYGFLEAMMDRVVREGLLVPDELPFAAGLWDRIKSAQIVQAPAQIPEGTAHHEGGDDGRTD